MDKDQENQDHCQIVDDQIGEIVIIMEHNLKHYEAKLPTAQEIK